MIKNKLSGIGRSDAGLFPPCITSTGAETEAHSAGCNGLPATLPSMSLAS